MKELAPKRLYIFSNYEESRLNAFSNILERIQEVEMDSRERNLAWVDKDKHGNILYTVFDLDDKLARNMRRMAYRIYESDFENDPRLKEASQDISNFVNEKYAKKESKWKTFTEVIWKEDK